MEQYEVKAVCDTYEDKATDFALKLKEKYGVETKAYTDYEEMFEKEKPQAVVIAASWEMHVPIAIKAMERGLRWRSKWTVHIRSKNAGIW